MEPEPEKNKKENQKEEPKEAQKEAPKEEPKEALKEVPKEESKEESKESQKENQQKKYQKRTRSDKIQRSETSDSSDSNDNKGDLNIAKDYYEKEYYDNISCKKIKFMINKEAKYSISRPYEAQQITNFICDKCSKYTRDSPKDLIITDATACVGGDTISFANAFLHVLSIEMNNNNIKLLEENIKIHNKKNITIIQDDYTKIWKNLLQDIIYIDAPWNGISYKTKKDVDLFLSNIPLYELVDSILNYVKLIGIFLKVPLNLNMTHYQKYLKDSIIIKNKNGKDSFKILFLKYF